MLVALVRPNVLFFSFADTADFTVLTHENELKQLYRDWTSVDRWIGGPLQSMLRDWRSHHCIFLAPLVILES